MPIPAWDSPIMGCSIMFMHVVLVRTGLQCKFACVHVCKISCLRAYMVVACTCVRVCAREGCVCAYMHTCVLASEHECVHIRVQACGLLWQCTHAHTYRHTCVHRQAHMHKHELTRSDIAVCTHTYTHELNIQTYTHAL